MWMGTNGSAGGGAEPGLSHALLYRNTCLLGFALGRPYAFKGRVPSSFTPPTMRICSATGSPMREASASWMMSILRGPNRQPQPTQSTHVSRLTDPVAR